MGIMLSIYIVTKTKVYIDNKDPLTVKSCIKGCRRLNKKNSQNESIFIYYI